MFFYAANGSDVQIAASKIVEQCRKYAGTDTIVFAMKEEKERLDAEGKGPIARVSPYERKGLKSSAMEPQYGSSLIHLFDPSLPLIPCKPLFEPLEWEGSLETPDSNIVAEDKLVRIFFSTCLQFVETVSVTTPNA